MLRDSLWRRTLSSVSVRTIVLAFGFLSINCLVAAQEFVPSCPLPFDSIKEAHPIDSSCGPNGVATAEAHRAQNRIKNNFCATGSPVRVTFNTFVRLQSAAEQKHVSFGSSNSLPSDRLLLAGIYTTSSGVKLGEGSPVKYVAFVLDAHHSNVSNGESVNCKKGGKSNNDIHIALGRTPNEDLCNSVTAEMSPHFRPPACDQLTEIHIGNRPVRITGQLFFDASHKPCKGTSRPSPQRASIWEIHPVYAVDVCSHTTLSGCNANDESVWTPLHVWLASDENEPRAASNRFPANEKQITRVLTSRQR